MSKTNSQKKYLTQAEVAEHFGMSESTIKNWRDRGHLPYFQMPGSTRVLYPICEIEEVEQRYTYPTKEVVKGPGSRPEIKRKKPEISATINKKWRI